MLFSEVSPPLEFIEPHVTLNFHSSFFSPIYITPSSIFVFDLDPNSPSSSSNPPKCSKDTRGVPTTTPLPI